MQQHSDGRITQYLMLRENKISSRSDSDPMTFLFALGGSPGKPQRPTPSTNDQ